MNKTFKKLLISGASLLMLASVGAEMNNVIKPVHADAPFPVYYNSTKHKDNVYYKFFTQWDHGHKGHNYLIYGPMPKVMRSKHNLFGLYYGKPFTNPLPYKILHRHGQTYLPDYVGYTVGEHNIKYDGHTAFVTVVYVNKRDIGKRVKHQSRLDNNPKDMFNSERQFLIPQRHTRKAYRHAKRHYKRSRLIRFRRGHHIYYARIYKTARE